MKQKDNLKILHLIIFAAIMILHGCALVTDENNEVVNTTRPMFIFCVFAACEHEVQDGHATGEQEEGAQDVSPNISIPVEAL